ncbi:MAG: hypothetical protein GEV07_13375 [Streptosporangiales bacterium]|nr:hypothetical protein [Streptosporangiales bacterium]
MARSNRRQRQQGGGRLRLFVPIPLLVTVALLAVVVGVGELTLPDERSQVTGLKPAHAAVSAARVVCPDATGGDVAAVAPDRGKGEVAVGEIDSSTSTPVESLGTAPGRAVLQPENDGGVVVGAKGATAPGFEAEQYRRKDDGKDRGMADVRCATPSNNWWFAGPPTTGGASSELYLSNIDSAAATVDVLVYGPDGPVDPNVGRGISVDPGEQRVVSVTELAPELPVSAVRVVAKTGRVAASVRSEVKDGGTSYGASWVPPATPKSGNLIVPALPPGAGDRKLVLFTPSGEDSTVHLRLSTSDGSFAPAGKDRVDLPAQQAISVDLSEMMTKSVTALQVNAQVPLVGAVVAAEGGSGEDGDLAYSATSPSLGSGGIAAMVPAGNLNAAMALTAPTRDAEVEVRTLTDDGPSDPKRVRIGAGKTEAVKLRAPKGAENYGVLVSPQEGSGPVYGARLLTASPDEGPLLTSLALRPGVREVTLPPVVPEIGAGVPR